MGFPLSQELVAQQELHVHELGYTQQLSRLWEPVGAVASAASLPERALASPEPPPIGRELLDESGRMRTGPPGPCILGPRRPLLCPSSPAL